MGQSLILAIFSRLGDTPFFDKMWPRKLTSAWKKKDFFGLIFRSNSETESCLTSGQLFPQRHRCHLGKITG